MTIAGWFNWNGGNDIGSQEVLFYNGTTSTTGYGLIVAPTADGLDVQGLAGGQSVLDGNTVLSANQWYFVALTRVDGVFHLYVDGVEDTDLADAGSGVAALGAGDQMQIGGLGAFYEPEIFSGAIADVSVWNSALDQSQIQAIAGALLPGNETGVAGYYPLNVSLFDGVSFNTGAINTNGAYTPQVTNNGGTLELTDGNGSEATSWFASNKVSIDAFTASFDYQATGTGGLADGLAFILQDSDTGASALGGAGSSLGYGPDSGHDVAAISPSAAIELNLYEAPGATDQGSHIPGTNFAENGDFGSYYSTGAVDFWDTGDTVQVVLTYDGSTLTETLTDLVTGATYATSYDNINLAQVLGSDTAYVGFSAGTGGGTSVQTVSNFTYFPGAASDIVTTENAPVLLNGLGVSNANASDTITVTLDVNDGALTLGSIGGLTIVGGNDGSHGTLEFTGSLGAVDTALDSGLTYTPTTDFHGTDTLTFTASDGGVASVPESSEHQRHLDADRCVDVCAGRRLREPRFG